MYCSFDHITISVPRLSELGCRKLVQYCLLVVCCVSILICSVAVTPSKALAAEEFNTTGIMALAYKYYSGRGGAVNYARALNLYRKAALLGNVQAQFIVGGMYYRGQGADINRREGFKWLLKAAEQGTYSPESLAIIGSMYLQGIGVPQNFLEADKYLQLAADMGDVSAKKNLAYMAYSGMGGDSPDYARALALYTDVALQGDNAAQNNVGLMHVNGLGTEVDRVKGYAWYSLAASQGNTGAMVARNNLMVKMNFDELNRAQALAVKLYQQVDENLSTAAHLQ